jgi:HlyD family secretion protein
MKAVKILCLALLGVAALRADAERQIGAFGRLQPASGVIELSTFPGEIVSAVRVSVGDKVQAGQTLLEMALRETAAQELQLAELALSEAQQAGPLAVKFRQLALDQALADSALAKDRLARYLALGENAISSQELEVRKQLVASSSTLSENAKTELASATVRAEVALARARIQIAQARRRLDSMTILAPCAGTVLDVPAVAGGRAGPVGIKMADTGSMVVIADVFEGDFGRVKIGMKCEVRHDALGKTPLTGRLVRLGRIVNTTAKSAQVWIELDQAQPADRFIGMEVNVTIIP